MTDHYGDAIRAGAAALAAPYREAETIRAFTDEYPTLAAARVLDAALPHMRAAILAEGVAPGPCPAVTDFGHQGAYFDGVTPEPRTLRALCDLRAGHPGQHEAEDEQWGHFRWTDKPPPAQVDVTFPSPADTQCGDRIQFTPTDLRVCERRAGHSMYHIDGQLVWDDRRGILLAPPQRTSGPAAHA
jgi:hypothetical protein